MFVPPAEHQYRQLVLAARRYRADEVALGRHAHEVVGRPTDVQRGVFAHRLVPDTERQQLHTGVRSSSSSRSRRVRTSPAPMTSTVSPERHELGDDVAASSPSRA
jgi:hypothetical protein